MSVVPAVTVEHWFDFICPHCYVAQDRNRILRRHGLHLVGHALQIHPEIGPGGAFVGPRSGPTYEFLAREAELAGLPMRWTDRIPYSRPALAAFEWLRGSRPEVAERFATAVFDAYFGEGLDIESDDLLVRLAEEAGGDGDALRAARASAEAALVQSEHLARERGVTSTPTWIAGSQRISGVHPRRWFEDWAAALTR
ncbi:DsbA family oxidoreductase [Pseudonocardia adelaidensis]|uniref:DSBA-like thioredoxin domain-containing protein n=1 Tax=Pseudonocardia adelaidensis TaxID=648754 RepID=A0ABP9NLA5_9PSEU